MVTLTKPARVLGLTGCLGDFGSSTFPVRLSVTGCFPTCLEVVGILDPFLLFFFLIFLFFFFLSIGLLASELSLDEEDEKEEDLASEEGEEDLTYEEGEGST
jgi:hypothetical protein